MVYHWWNTGCSIYVNKKKKIVLFYRSPALFDKGRGRAVHWVDEDNSFYSVNQMRAAANFPGSFRLEGFRLGKCNLQWRNIHLFWLWITGTRLSWARHQIWHSLYPTTWEIGTILLIMLGLDVTFWHWHARVHPRPIKCTATSAYFKKCDASVQSEFGIPKEI